jgi:hypothetical protein
MDRKPIQNALTQDKKNDSVPVFGRGVVVILSKETGCLRGCPTVSRLEMLETRKE